MSIFDKIGSYLGVPLKAVKDQFGRDLNTFGEKSLEAPEQGLIGLTNTSKAVQGGLEDASVWAINKEKEMGVPEGIANLEALPSVLSRMALPQTEEETGAMLATPLVNPLAKFMVEEGGVAGRGMYQGGKTILDKIAGSMPPPPSAMEPALAEGISTHIPSTTLMPAENKGGMMLAEETKNLISPEVVTSKTTLPPEAQQTFMKLQAQVMRNIIAKGDVRESEIPILVKDKARDGITLRAILESKMKQFPNDEKQAIDAATSEYHGFLQKVKQASEPIPKPYAAPFYSYLEQTVQDKMPNQTSGKSLQGLLTNAAVKKEELQYSGMEDLFEKPIVTKQEVMDHLQANKIELKEITKGAGKGVGKTSMWGVMDEQGEIIEGFPTRAQADEYASHLQRINPDERLEVVPGPDTELTGEDLGTKYENYQLPGGKNYKEMLFQLPYKEPGSGLTKQEAKDFDRLHDSLMYEFGGDTGNWPAADSRVRHLRELSGKMADHAAEGANYQSSHFDEPNILAHTRFNEVKDAQGKKVLRIEEIQSDWHQAGREEGYIQPNAEFSVDKMTLPELKAFARRVDENGYLNIEDEDLNSVERMRELVKFNVQNGYWSLNEKEAAKYAGVPDAPFKKNWHEMVMRRMIRYAAENGFDKVAWTTGEQQAKRYSLSKQIEHIEWADLQDGMRHIELKPKGTDTNIVIRTDAAGKVTAVNGAGADNWVGKDLKQVIGKGIAEKVYAEGTGKLTGVGLDIGGEGMKGFYDEMLPSYVNKFTKKWGGQVVDEAYPVKGIRTFKPYEKEELKDTIKSIMQNDHTFEEAQEKVHELLPDYDLPENLYEDMLDAGRDSSRGNTATEFAKELIGMNKANKLTLHTLTITPEMKRAALTKGFPLFSGLGIMQYLNDGKEEKKKGVQ